MHEALAGTSLGIAMFQVPAGSFEGRSSVRGFGVGVVSGGAVEVTRVLVLREVVFLVAYHIESLA